MAASIPSRGAGAPAALVAPVALAALAALAVAAAAMVAGCGAAGLPAGMAPGRVPVVAGEDFWGSIAAQVGGDRVSVFSIVTDPNTDPHTYQSDPRAAAEVGNARLVIENGLGYDDFLHSMLAVGGPSGRRVLVVARALGVGGDANPHLWYWTDRMPAVASAIAAELSALDPAGRAYFDTNVKAFDAGLAPVLATIAAIRARYSGDPVGYTERLPGYLLAEAGLDVVTPTSFARAVEDGDDPSPGDVAAFDRAVTGHRIRVLLYNAQVVDAQTAQLERLARRAGVPVVGVSETMPPADTFQQWQLDQDRALLGALGG